MCGWACSSQFREERNQGNGGLGGGRRGCSAKSRAGGGLGTVEREHSRARQGPGFKVGRAILALGRVSSADDLSLIRNAQAHISVPRTRWLQPWAQDTSIEWPVREKGSPAPLAS